MAPRTVVYRPKGADYEIRVLGSKPTPLRDFYHALLRLNWPWTLVLLTVAHLVINACFAVAYWLVGGIGSGDGSFDDAFFFSVQTMGTIGYGVLSPRSVAANWLVVFESVTGLLVTALSTGLVFAKLSRPTARVVFSQQAVVCPVDGVQTLLFRLSNERGNAIVNAQLQAVVMRTERTQEGETLYRSYDLKLVRDRALSLNRSFSLSHRIEPGSPFWGKTAHDVAAEEYELSVMVTGLDDTSMQTVYASHLYFARDIVFDARLVDILSEHSDGSLVLDLTRFHDIQPIVAERRS